MKLAMSTVCGSHCSTCSFCRTFDTRFTIASIISPFLVPRCTSTEQLMDASESTYNCKGTDPMGHPCPRSKNVFCNLFLNTVSHSGPTCRNSILSASMSIGCEDTRIMSSTRCVILLMTPALVLGRLPAIGYPLASNASRYTCKAVRPAGHEWPGSKNASRSFLVTEERHAFCETSMSRTNSSKMDFPMARC